jgi:hypothetical protein
MFNLIVRSKALAGFAGVVLSLTLAVTSLVSVAPTYAAPPTPSTSPAAARTAALEAQLKREQGWLTVQGNQLERAGQVAAKVQQYIDAQNAAGKDTSALASALAIFQSQIATAQSSHDAAAKKLNEHAGFDASGHVTDALQARQTLIDGQQLLWDGHHTLQQAALDLRVAIHTYRQANQNA